MGQRSIRQEARRAALDAQSKRRENVPSARSGSRTWRCGMLVALRERDEAVADAERRARQALRQMTGEEGMSVREAVEWCGDEITTREATRLRRLAANGEMGEPEMDDNRPVGSGVITRESKLRGRRSLPACGGPASP
jgi:hypothetical protein